MLSILKVSVVLILLGIVQCVEHTNHGPRAPHTSDDDTHNAAFDHEAVLGSEDLEEEFAGLPPQEAKNRLRKLAEQHDSDGNGHISKDEMYRWITDSFISLDREEGMEKFIEEDEDKNEQVSWEEYLHKVYGFSLSEVEDMRQSIDTAKEDSDDIRELKSSLKMLEEDQRFFNGADLDKDGSLNADEYMAFFFPHNYEHMHEFELERYLSQHDGDGDGKMTLAEFTGDGPTDEHRITSKENFDDLDKDKDSILDRVELKEWVVPGTDELAEEEASHLISMGDANEDGQLSIEEIVDKTEQFVGSSATDYGNFLQHEEL